jgi:four helix bundle protein
MPNNYKTQKLQEAKTQSNLKNSNQNNKIYNLEERLRKFFERVAKLCKKISLNARTERSVSQLMGASGSMGANYAEASEAMSKRDFVKSIKIVRKEAKEACFWLHGLKVIVDFQDPEFDALIQESTEFGYIFTSILKKADIK